jgi:hypothetical protein
MHTDKKTPTTPTHAKTAKMDNLLDDSSIHPGLNSKAVKVGSCLVDAANQYNSPNILEQVREVVGVFALRIGHVQFVQYKIPMEFVYNGLPAWILDSNRKLCGLSAKSGG